MTPVPSKPFSLSRLGRGEPAVIDRLAGRAETMLHLVELGLCAGESVRVMRWAPGGDALVLEIMGYRLAIRRAEADAILVRRDGGLPDGR